MLNRFFAELPFENCKPLLYLAFTPLKTVKVPVPESAARTTSLDKAVLASQAFAPAGASVLLLKVQMPVSLLTEAPL